MKPNSKKDHELSVEAGVAIFHELAAHMGMVYAPLLTSGGGHIQSGSRYHGRLSIDGVDFFTANFDTSSGMAEIRVIWVKSSTGREFGSAARIAAITVSLVSSRSSKQVATDILRRIVADWVKNRPTAVEDARQDDENIAGAREKVRVLMLAGGYSEAEVASRIGGTPEQPGFIPARHWTVRNYKDGTASHTFSVDELSNVRMEISNLTVEQALAVIEAIKTNEGSN